MLLAAKVSDTAPDAFVLGLIVMVPLLNVPLAPVLGARKTTVAPLIATPPASFTTAASGKPNAVPAAVLCGVPPVGVTEAGTCVTVTVLLVVAAEPKLLWIVSPPPHVATVFVTKIGEFDGTLTMILIVGYELPPVTTCVLVQVTVVLVDDEQLNDAGMIMLDIV